jgi:hypothetical protein
VDQSGFYLLPCVVRTYAPVGQMPIVHEHLSRDHLSVISAITLEGKLLMINWTSTHPGSLAIPMSYSRSYSPTRRQSSNHLHARCATHHTIRHGVSRALPRRSVWPSKGSILQITFPGAEAVDPHTDRAELRRYRGCRVAQR